MIFRKPPQGVTILQYIPIFFLFNSHPFPRRKPCGPTKKLFVLTSLVLLFALVLTAPVFADGEAPPEETPNEAPAEEAPAEEAPTEPAAEESAPAEDTPQVAEETPANDAVEAVEAEEATDEPAEEEISTEEVEAEETTNELTPQAEEVVELAEAAAEEIEATDEDAAATDEEILIETESSTDVVLVDASGEAVDMASQESEGLQSRPHSKVGSTTYRFFASGGVCAVSYPGDPNCHDGEGSDVIQDALQYMTDNSVLPSNRMLYVEGGTYDGFTIDGTASSQMAQLKGVIGEDGSQNTWIDGDINAWSNTGGFTLQGFTIDHINGYQIHFSDNPEH